MTYRGYEVEMLFRRDADQQQYFAIQIQFNIDALNSKYSAVENLFASDSVKQEVGTRDDRKKK